MSRNKNTYASAILQKRVPADLLPELREMVDIRVASFKREQAAKERMQQQIREAK